MAKKKNCKVGWSCGMSCISTNKICKKEYPEDVSVSLDKRAVALAKDDAPAAPAASGKLTKDSYDPVPFDKEVMEKTSKPTGGADYYGEGDIIYSVDPQRKWWLSKLIKSAADDEGNIDKNAAVILDKEWNGKAFEISWGVKKDPEGGVTPTNLGLSSDEGGDRSPKERLKLLFSAKKAWEKQILPNLEEGTLIMNTPLGGAEGVRDRLYQKAGFGRVGNGGDQYAIVKNGKLVPVEFGPPSIKYKNMRKEKPDWDFAEKLSRDEVIALAKEVGVTLDKEEIELYLNEALK